MSINYEKLYKADEWFEELGPVLWWDQPASEPPWAGTPLDDQFDPLSHTHFTILPNIKQENGEPIYGKGYYKALMQLNKKVG